MNDKPCKVERVERQIIENKLLVSLDEGNCVALLLSEKNLDDLISWLCIANGFEGPNDYAECRSFIADLRQLRKGTFGK